MITFYSSEHYNTTIFVSRALKLILRPWEGPSKHLGPTGKQVQMTQHTQAAQMTDYWIHTDHIVQYITLPCYVIEHKLVHTDHIVQYSCTYAIEYILITLYITAELYLFLHNMRGGGSVGMHEAAHVGICTCLDHIVTKGL